MNSVYILFTASVSLKILERNSLRPDIDCPGDTLSYNCSILSNSENINLMWHVTFPGSEPLSISYNVISVPNVKSNLAMNISTILTGFRRDQYIESILVFTLSRGFQMNGTKLECNITDLDNEITYVFFNISGMLSFIIEIHHYATV